MKPEVHIAQSPFATKGLVTDALTAITALAQSKSHTRNIAKPLCDLPEAGPVRMAIKAAVEAGAPGDHIRELMKAAFGGDLAGQSNCTVGQAALFPAMEPEMAQASMIPDHEEGLERSIAKAQTICCAERPIEKAQVGAYTRTHMGKVIQVQEYTTRRQGSMNATKQAHAFSDEAMKAKSPESHQKAVEGHMDALRHHTEAHELSPSDVAGDHKELMEHHRAAARWHSDKVKGDSGAYGVKKEEPRGEERVAVKAHHEASTRKVGGKVVTVKAYDDKRKAAEKASASAHTASKNAKTPADHDKAADLHKAAVDAHREARYANVRSTYPDRDQQAEHRQKELDHDDKYCEHAQIFTDSTDDEPTSHGLTIAHLTQHDLDYKGGGRGYLGHEWRGDHTDKALVEAANKHGLDEHELDTYAKSRPGRHDMDATDGYPARNPNYRPDDHSDEENSAAFKAAHAKIPHAKLVDHFHKAIGAVKGEKWFKEDAEERRNPPKD